MTSRGQFSAVLETRCISDAFLAVIVSCSSTLTFVAQIAIHLRKPFLRVYLPEATRNDIVKVVFSSHYTIVPGHVSICVHSAYFDRVLVFVFGDDTNDERPWWDAE